MGAMKRMCPSPASVRPQTEVSVDVVGMVLVFHKRSVRVDIANAYLLALSCERLEVFYESSSVA
jgi:hypothetical protein